MRRFFNKLSVLWLLFWTSAFMLFPILGNFFILCFSNLFYFFIFFCVFFLLNFLSLVFFRENKNFFKFDLLLKLLSFFNRNFKLSVNFVKVRFMLFFVFFKDTTKRFYTFIDAFYKNIKLNNYKWRPLFKKTSYFGFFRSHRSKWFK